MLITQRRGLEIDTHNQQIDRDKTVSASRRPVKLVDQMRDCLKNGQGLSSEAREEKSPAVAKAPDTRRTRRSSPVHVAQEALPERWTDQNTDWRTQWYQSLVFPASGKNRATVDDGDIPRLDEGQLLNDNLVSFYIRYLQFKLESEKPELSKKIYFFSTFFFEKLRSTKGKINYDGVKAWTSKIDLLSYDYIVVPVNEHAHWYLAVICNMPNAVNGIPQEGDNKGTAEHVDHSSPRIAVIERDMSVVTLRDGDTKQQSVDVEIVHSPPSSAKTMQSSSPVSKTMAPADSQLNAAAPRHDDPRAPKIITLDSLANAHPTTCKALREYLVAEAKDKKGVDLVKVPNGMTAKRIPEQNNFCDCGVFVLGYMEEFLKDPDETVRKLLQREPLEWDIRPSHLRHSLRELLFKLQHEQHERHTEEKEQKRLLSAKRQTLVKDANRSTRKTGQDVSLTPGKKSSPAELPGTNDIVTDFETCPRVVEVNVEDNARSSRRETAAKSRGERYSEAASSMDNKCGAGGTRDLGPSSSSHVSSEGGMAVCGTKNAIATTSTRPEGMNKQELVETLATSSPEAEIQVTQTVSNKVNRASMESRDVEEGLSILGSRATRQRSKRLGSSSSMIEPLRSSQSLSPKSQQAKYNGIERSVDLT